MSDQPPAQGAPRLVPTKIRPPIVDERLTRRHRLDNLFDQGARILLVVAPAGFGKTVAVAQWTQHLAEPVAWFTIDEHDRSASRFWRHLAAALERAVPALGGETIRSIDDWAIDGIDMATVLLAELGEERSPIVLVLDDVHLAAPDLADQLAFFIERSPAWLRVVMTTRTVPALPVARWRATMMLTEIRQRDLALRPDEAHQVLRSSTSSPLDAATEQLLIERTDGWPAALQLAGLSLHGRDDADRFARDVLSSDRMLFDYVVAEVLDRLPSDEREVVLALSVLDDIDPRRCEAVAACPDGEAMIDALVRHGLPLVALEPTRRSFRLHDLFRSLVRFELELRDPSAVAALHRRAAEAEQAAGDEPAAVRHLLAAGDRHEAFDLVFGPVWDLYRSGTMRQLGAWLDQFPADFVGADPARIIPFATALSLIGRLDDAARWNDLAALSVDAEHGLANDLAVSRMLVDLGRGDTPAVRHEFERLDAAVANGSVHAEQEARVATIMALSALIDDDIDEAARWVDAIGTVPTLPERARVVGHPARRAWLAVEQGWLDESERLADASLAESGDDRRGAAHVIAELYVVKARLATERLDTDAADEWSDRALELVADLGSPPHRLLAHAAAIDATEARFGARRASIVAADMAATDLREAMQPRYALLRAGLAARAGRWDEAERFVADLPMTPRRRLVDAHTAIGRGGPTAVDVLLVDTGGWPLRRRIEADLMRFAARPGTAHHLERALELGADRGFVWTYLREGPTVVAELRRMVRSDPRWASARITSALREQPLSPSADVPALVEALSGKELEVLRLLPTHLSTVEIAQRLFVSANTVRTHVKAIYRKLGVGSRSEAVRRGLALGLSSPDALT